MSWIERGLAKGDLLPYRVRMPAWDNDCIPWGEERFGPLTPFMAIQIDTRWASMGATILFAMELDAFEFKIAWG